MEKNLDKVSSYLECGKDLLCLLKGQFQLQLNGDGLAWRLSERYYVGLLMVSLRMRWILAVG